MAERYKDPDWLREKYISEDLTMQEVGDLCGKSVTVIQYWTDKLGIEKDEETPQYHDEDWLREKYWDEGLSQREMADIVGTGRARIQYWMKKHDIERRSVGQQPIGETAMYRSFYKTRDWRDAKSKARERDDEECQECGSDDDLHVHHIEPMSQGGAKLDLDNLVTLCRDCHYAKH